jgi:hypothetical protein
VTGAVPWSVELPWLLLGGRLGLDGAGHAFLLLSLLLWVAAALAAPGWWRGDARTQRWAVATLAGHLLVHVALDAATFQLGYALMGLASFGLLAARRTPAADAAARRYLVFVIVGEVLLFAGLVLGYGRAGSADVARLTPALATAPQAGAAVSLVVIAFAIKSAVLPLHGWLLSGYVAAPLPVRVVLAGAMINAGLLGWLRFVPLGSARRWPSSWPRWRCWGSWAPGTAPCEARCSAMPGRRWPARPSARWAWSPWGSRPPWPRARPRCPCWWPTARIMGWPRARPSSRWAWRGQRSAHRLVTGARPCSPCRCWP